MDVGARGARVPGGRLRCRRAAVQHSLRQRRRDRRGHRTGAQPSLRGQHRARAVAGRRPDARRQRPHRARQGALQGTARSARRDGQCNTPGRLLADHRGDRQMTIIRSTATQSAVSEPTIAPTFAVISGAQVQNALHGREKQILELVEATYRLHSAGDSVNPPSYFLRFPDRPSSRIIALPASIGGQARVDGLKWISSFPENTKSGLPRASAVLILNDPDTGYPYACLESSVISATRTASSAALAADRLSRTRPRPTRVGFFGTGLIARDIPAFLTGTAWTFDTVGVYDVS